MRQINIHQHATFINTLVEVPQFLFRATVIPPRQLLVNLAHRFNVETPVLAKSFPLGRVRFASSTTEYLILRAWFAEQLDQRLTGLVLRLVLRDAKDIAQLLQSAWKAVRHGTDHRIERLFYRNREAYSVSHDGTVESAVLNHLLVSRIGQ
ncbi:hypothetical protein D3C80_1326430 [compost metagenome]